MKKVPTIVLSVSYKGVKFIDATNKVGAYGETWFSRDIYLFLGIFHLRNQ